LEYCLDRVRGANVDDAVLTVHQREVLEGAIDPGYDEQPRDTSLTDLAAELDVVKSTLSGVLRRAEAVLSQAYVDDATRWDRQPPAGADFRKVQTPRRGTWEWKQNRSGW
jgi:hypothetical protein